MISRRINVEVICRYLSVCNLRCFVGSGVPAFKLDGSSATGVFGYEAGWLQRAQRAVPNGFASSVREMGSTLLRKRSQRLSTALLGGGEGVAGAGAA